MRIKLMVAVLGMSAGLLFGQSEPQRPVRFEYAIDHSMSLDELIVELRDDHVLWNARTAIKAIMSYPTSPIDRLYEALDDPDYQVRQIACNLLWGLREAHAELYSDNDMVSVSYTRWKPTHHGPQWRWDANPAITDRLVAVTIEGLRDDPTPYDHPRRRALMYTNAAHGFNRLVPIATDWRAELEAALESDDAQQQLVAALILGFGGVDQSVDLAAPILLPHLRDNNIGGDARMCVLALAKFGKPVLPILKKAMPGADQQQRDLLTLLILDITDPPITEHDRIARSRFNTITTIVHDPAIESHGTSQWSWLDKVK